MDIMDPLGNKKENLSCYQIHRIVELFPDMGVVTSSAKAARRNQWNIMGHQRNFMKCMLAVKRSGGLSNVCLSPVWGIP